MVLLGILVDYVETLQLLVQVAAFQADLLGRARDVGVVLGELVVQVFTLEAPPGRLGGRELGEHQLDGDLALEPGVLGPEHLPARARRRDAGGRVGRDGGPGPGPGDPRRLDAGAVPGRRPGGSPRDGRQGRLGDRVTVEVLRGGEVVATVGDGERVQRLASISKPMAAWATLIAVEEGSTEVRLGTVLLGERPEERWI